MLHFYLNDKRIDVDDISPTTTLLNYLRQNLTLTGTKEGCAEGDCGACTVSIAMDNHKGQPSYRSINSCLLLVASLNGKRIYTVEGIAEGSKLHPVQQAMVEKLGSQCGYCTPGIIMSMFSSCYRRDISEDWQIDDQMCGNLCRCTGYRPIRDAAIATAGLCPDDKFQKALDSHEPCHEYISFKRQDNHFYMPVSLSQLWEVLAKHPEHRFVSGATDLGLDITKRHASYPCLISLEGLASLKTISKTGDAWRIGAFVPLSDIELEFTESLNSLTRMLRYFGARQIKNRATLGGNICNASPIGDTPPVLLSLNATVVLLSSTGERRLPISQFFVDYRKTALKNGEILGFIEIPFIDDDYFYASYKISKRRELDISAVAAGMCVKLDSKGCVNDIRLAYGGLAAIPKRAHTTEKALIGKPWSLKTINDNLHHLSVDFTPMSDQRGTAWFRHTLAKNLLIGFYEESCNSHKVVDDYLPRKHSGTVSIVELK